MNRKVIAAILEDGVSGQVNLFRDYSFIHMSMWDSRNRYGQDRWNLLQHCITKLNSISTSPQG